MTDRTEALDELIALDADMIDTPSHPFTPDVVAWAEDVCRDWMRKNGYDEEPRVVKAAHQILVATGREEPRFVRVPHIGEAS